MLVERLTAQFLDYICNYCAFWYLNQTVGLVQYATAVLRRVVFVAILPNNCYPSSKLYFSHADRTALETRFQTAKV